MCIYLFLLEINLNDYIKGRGVVDNAINNDLWPINYHCVQFFFLEDLYSGDFSPHGGFFLFLVTQQSFWKMPSFCGENFAATTNSIDQPTDTPFDCIEFFVVFFFRCLFFTNKHFSTQPNM